MRRRGLRESAALSRFSLIWLFETPWAVSREAHLPTDSPGKNTEGGYHAPYRWSSQPGVKPGPPAGQAASLPPSHLGSPKRKCRRSPKDGPANSCSLSQLPPYLVRRMGFPGGSAIKRPLPHAGDTRSVPRLGQSPGKGNGNPLQYSCLENPMDRGAWWATVPGVVKSQTRLND